MSIELPRKGRPSVRPLISIIMPCYNEERGIERSITSALQQTYGNLELIIVDDGSTDGTRDIISGIDDTRVKLIAQSNKGVCAARNRGIAKATGEYIAFLDADDWWAPNCLEELFSVLSSLPEAALAYCGWQNIGLPGKQSEPFIPPDYETPDKAAQLLVNCRWPIHAALTRKEAVEQADGFDEEFVTSEDFSLWLRIGVRQKIICVPRVLAFYYHHEGTQATKNKLNIARNHWLVQRKFLRENPDIASHIGKQRIHELTDRELLRRGYQSYWKRDLAIAHAIFRMVLRIGFVEFYHLKYTLPALLPFSMYRWLIHIIDRTRFRRESSREAR